MDGLCGLECVSDGRKAVAIHLLCTSCFIYSLIEGTGAITPYSTEGKSALSTSLFLSHTQTHTHPCLLAHFPAHSLFL